MQPKPNIVHLPVYQPGKSVSEVQKEYGLKEIIKLASNENAYGCSPKVKEAILAEFENTNIYPDGASVELTAALSEHLGVEPNQLIFGAGSDEVILMTARAYLMPGDETIMASTTFPQYKHNAEIEGAKIIEVPLKDGVHDLKAMAAQVNERTKIIWICNPNNPTGTMNTHSEMVELLESVPSDVLVILDEAYYEYNTSPDYADGMKLLAQYPNVLLLRTFSKIYGLASLRIGYGIGRPEVIHTINQVREPFNTTRYAQSAALAALADQDFIQSCREKNKQGLEYFYREFDRLGLSYFPSIANFVMVDVQRPAKDVFESMIRRGIIVRQDPQWSMPTHIRITVGTMEQNEKCIVALEEALDEVSVKVSS